MEGGGERGGGYTQREGEREREETKGGGERE